MHMFIVVYEHKVGNRMAGATQTIVAKNSEDAKMIFYRDNQHLALAKIIRVNEVWSTLV